jgi:hypothetical protein
MGAPASLADFKDRLVAIVNAAGGSAATPDERTVSGTLTAISAKWFLGGRKVTNTIRCVLDPLAHEVRFREAAVDSSWGLPPPTFTVETTRQSGTNVDRTRTDKGIGGGGRLEFGKFREAVSRAAQDCGWTFISEVV